MYKFVWLWYYFTVFERMWFLKKKDITFYYFTYCVWILVIKWYINDIKFHKWSPFINSRRRRVAEILPIRRKTQNIQSINQSKAIYIRVYRSSNKRMNWYHISHLLIIMHLKNNNLIISSTLFAFPCLFSSHVPVLAEYA